MPELARTYARTHECMYEQMPKGMPGLHARVICINMFRIAIICVQASVCVYASALEETDA